MRFFDVNILTDKQLNTLFKQTVRIRQSMEYPTIVEELQRLKKDHWDKCAFDRLINYFSEQKYEKMD